MGSKGAKRGRQVHQQAESLCQGKQSVCSAGKAQGALIPLTQQQQAGAGDDGV